VGKAAAGSRQAGIVCAARPARQADKNGDIKAGPLVVSAAGAVDVRLCRPLRIRILAQGGFMAVSRTKQRSRTSRQISRTALGRNRDRPLVSIQPYDLEYLRKRFPKVTRTKVAQALSDCQDEVKTDDRQEIMKCLKRKLGQPRG
jgi:hypothetical protein